MPKAKRENMSFREGLDVLSTHAQIARSSFEIWWVMQGADTRPRYVATMNRLWGFFAYTIEAHLAHLVVTLARFYDKQANTLTLSWLIDRAEVEGLPSEVLYAARVQVGAGAAFAENVNRLRSTVYAHRSSLLKYKEAFRKANISADGLRGHCESITVVLNHLRRAVGLNELEVAPPWRGDTVELLERLGEPYDDRARRSRPAKR